MGEEDINKNILEKVKTHTSKDFDLSCDSSSFSTANYACQTHLLGLLSFSFPFLRLDEE